jgi:hypothetical protein
MNSPRIAMISSTSLDLPDHRKLAIEACNRMGYDTKRMETLSAKPDSPVEASLQLVEDAAIYILLVAWRYGAIPSGHEISITEMEYNKARELGKPVFAFFIKSSWHVNPEDIEMEAMVQLAVFKKRVGDAANGQVAGVFTTPEDLRGLIIQALQDWDSQYAPVPSAAPTITPTDPDFAFTAYRDRMIEETAKIPLMGLGSKIDEVSLPIAEAYVELETEAISPGEDRERDPEAQRLTRLQERVPLTGLFPTAENLSMPRHAVLVLGDPGAGKTTVTKRMFWELASAHVPASAYGLPDGAFPVLLKLQRLVPGDVLRDPDPASIPNWFHRSKDLLRAFLHRETDSGNIQGRARGIGELLWERGRIVWILDGLDEIPNAQARDLTLKQIAEAVRDRHGIGDRFLVTSRFSGTDGSEVTVPDCFARFDVKGLPAARREELIRKFFRKVAEQIRGKSP